MRKYAGCSFLINNPNKNSLHKDFKAEIYKLVLDNTHLYINISLLNILISLYVKHDYTLFSGIVKRFLRNVMKNNKKNA